MGDFYKDMYNFYKVKEYVDGEIEKNAPATIILTFDNTVGTYKCNYTYTEIKKMLDDNLPIADIIANDSTGEYHGGHISILASATSLNIVFISTFTRQSQYFDTAKFFGFTFTSSGTITKYVPAS